MMNNSWRDVDGHSDTQGPSGGKKRNPGSLCVLFLCYPRFCVLSNSRMRAPGGPLSD